MTMQEAQLEYFKFMGDSCGSEPELNLNDIERNIEECKSMLYNAIYQTNKDEIKFWRRMLQTAKAQKREFLAA